MPKPVQCKIIGAVSALLGIGVLAASSIYLHESTYAKCKEYYRDIVISPQPINFDHRTNTGGNHGGYNPHQGQYHSNYDDHYGGSHGYASSSSGAYGQGHRSNYPGGQGHGSNYPYDNDDLGYWQPVCSGIIQKYRACAIVAIVASILQILISIVYACASKDTVKTLSLGWIVTHAVIVLALISAAAVVLAEQRLEPWNRKGGELFKREERDDLPEKKLGFAILALLDSFFVVLMIIFAALTFRKSDYDNYEPKDLPKARKKFLES